MSLRGCVPPGINCEAVFKISEGRPNPADLLKNGEITMMMITSTGDEPDLRDGKDLRRLALSLQVGEGGRGWGAPGCAIGSCVPYDAYRLGIGVRCGAYAPGIVSGTLVCPRCRKHQDDNSGHTTHATPCTHPMVTSSSHFAHNLPLTLVSTTHRCRW
jgi:hypothetical protein